MITWYIQILVNGLCAGMLYVLIALGFSLIYSVMRVVNFAHGHLYMLGAMFTYLFSVTFGMHFFFALVLAMVAVGLLGMVLEKTIFTPLMANHEASVVAAVGTGIFLLGITEAITGGEVRGVPSPIRTVFEVGGVVLAGDRILILIASALFALVFYFLIYHTKLGRATRATVDDLEIAGAFAIKVKWIYTLNFGLSAALAGIAGVLISPIVGANTELAFPALLRAFVIVVIGGIGSLSGAVIAGLLLGFFDSVVTTLLSPQISEMAVFVAILILLIFRPTGLFGSRSW
jgi:branched-chain amino acid transport system permease protein